MLHLLTARGTDLHLANGKRPAIRVHGRIRELEDYAINTPDRLRHVLLDFLSEKQRAELEAELETDFVYLMPDGTRIHCMIYRDRGHLAAAFRLLPSEVPTATQLQLEQPILDWCREDKGLIIVAGSGGAGKSTTLAAMLDYVNTHRTGYIITVEDFIEYVHPSKNCVVEQRRAAPSLRGFAEAIQTALKDEPDVLLAGQMCDTPTLEQCLCTANRRLIFGVLHVCAAPEALDRIAGMFPAQRKPEICALLADSLRGVVTQCLLPSTDGKRVAAREILSVTPPVAALIRQGEFKQLALQMQHGAVPGATIMDDAIAELVLAGRVAPEVAYQRAYDPAALLQAYESHGIAWRPAAD